MEESNRLIKEETSGYDADQLPEEDEEELEEKTIEEFLQHLGFGRAQWLLWGFFFLIPIAKASQLYLVLILIPYLRCEWALGTGFEAAIGASAHIARCLTGIPLGGLADKYGRKRVLITALFTFVLSGVGAAVAPGKWFFLAARILQGFAMGICSHIPFIYVAETASSEFKEFAVLSMAVSTHFGCLFVSGLSFLLLNLVGWRNMMLIVTAPMFIIAVGLIFTPQTPRYALVSGGRREAIASLRTLYRLSGKLFPASYCLIECRNVTIVTGKTKARGNLKSLFTQGFACVTILLGCMNIGHNYLSAGFGAYLPLYKSSSAGAPSNVTRTTIRNVGLEGRECGHSLDQAGLFEIAASFSGDILGIVVTATISRRLGRTLALRIWAFYNVLTALPFFYKMDPGFEYVIVLSFKFFVSGFWYLLLLITVEVFPTTVRGTATSFISALGDTGGIGASLLVYSLYPISPVLVVGLFVGATVTKLFASLFWTKDSKDKDMADSFFEH